MTDMDGRHGCCHGCQARIAGRDESTEGRSDMTNERTCTVGRVEDWSGIYMTGRDLGAIIHGVN